ncbi:MAG: hypothetical protein ABFD04_00330 [Syntrophomonas sp.]
MKKILIILMLALAGVAQGQTFSTLLADKMQSHNFGGITMDELKKIVDVDSVNTIYYVSSTGSDSNDGLSPASPLAHHPWMSSYTGSITLEAGDVVCLKRGDTWSVSAPGEPYMTIAQSGSTGKYIVTTAFGTGAKPIVKIATNSNQNVIYGAGVSFIAIDNLDIQHYDTVRDDSGKSGIYFAKDGATVPHDWIITNNDIHNIPTTGINGADDSYNIFIGDTLATFTATATNHSNHVWNCGYTGIGLAGRNPATDKSNWIVSFNYIHDINSWEDDYENTYGLYFSSVLNSTGWPDHCTAKYNYIANIPVWHGIDTHGATYCYFLDNYLKNTRVAISAFTINNAELEAGILHHCFIERNKIENTGNHPGAFFYFGINVSGATTDLRPHGVYVRDNKIFYTSQPNSETSAYGIGVYLVDTLTISDNTIYNGPTGACNGAIYIGGSTGELVKNVTVQNNFVRDWSPALKIAPACVDGNLYIQNNILKSHGYALYAIAGTTAGDIMVYNNDLMQDAAINSYIAHLDGITLGAGKSLLIRNNIFTVEGAGGSPYYIATPYVIAGGTFTVNYNLYYNATGNAWRLQREDHNFADWQGHGYDANGVNASNPLFKNKSGTFNLVSDFELNTTSPAISVGTGVGIDYLGSAPDIGAKEKR